MLRFFLKRFPTLTHIAMMAPLYIAASLILGLAVTPSLLLFFFVKNQMNGFSPYLSFPLLGATIAAGFFIYGFCMIITIPLWNLLLVKKIDPWRGHYYSPAAIKWYIHNGLTYLVRFTFLEFITPTPFNILFFRWMGMKIGKGGQINSAHISDPSLYTLGNHVTIGGSATLVAHYGMNGFLILAPVKIGNWVTIGLKATILGDVEIGDGAKVLPNSVVLPGSRIPAGETWGGVPAQPINVKALRKVG